MYVPAQNVTDAQVVIDDEGRTLGGGEWGAVDRHDDHAQVAIGDGRLVIHPDLEDAPDLDASASAALKASGELEARRIELANADAERLRSIADGAGYDHAGDDLPTLRRRLTRRVEISLTSTPAAEPELAGDASRSGELEGDATAAPDLPKSKAPRGGAR